MSAAGLQTCRLRECLNSSRGSRDFVYWQPNGAMILKADEEDQRWARGNGGERADLHAMRGFPYEGLWLGLVERENLILPAIMKDGCALTNDDGARIHSLAYSRDGHSWHRLSDRTAPIPLGKDGEWDSADLGYPTSQPIVKDGQIWFFYRGGQLHQVLPKLVRQRRPLRKPGPGKRR